MSEKHVVASLRQVVLDMGWIIGQNDMYKSVELMDKADDLIDAIVAFIHALTVQATPGTDYYCPRCDHHDPDLDGRLILDRQDSAEAKGYADAR